MIGITIAEKYIPVSAVSGGNAESLLEKPDTNP